MSPPTGATRSARRTRRTIRACRMRDVAIDGADFGRSRSALVEAVQRSDARSLIERAVAGNLDLQSAVLRIAAAREESVAAAAQGLPQVSASASVKRQQLGLKGLLESQGVYDRLDGSARTARRHVSASIPRPGRSRSFRTASMRRGNSISSAACGARSNRRMRRRRPRSKAATTRSCRSKPKSHGLHAIARRAGDQADHARRNRRRAAILDLTREQARVGLTSQQDVQSASAQVGSLQAQLPTFDAQIAQAMNGLAVLTGSRRARSTRNCRMRAPCRPCRRRCRSACRRRSRAGVPISVAPKRNCMRRRRKSASRSRRCIRISR